MAHSSKRRRQQVAAAAFARRRGELGLTQQQVADRSGVSVRTVINFESQGTFPQPIKRAALEDAVGWPADEIRRLADGPPPQVSPRLLRELGDLTADERKWILDWLGQELGTEPGPPPDEGEWPGAPGTEHWPGRTGGSRSR